MTVDLHKLANTPGAGTARDTLRKAGCWQESDDDLPLWEVEIEASRPVKAVAYIAAPDAVSAKNAAHRVDFTRLDFDDDDYGLEIHGPSTVRPATTHEFPDLIVREGDA